MKARLKRQRHSIIKVAYIFSLGKEIWSEATFPSINFCHWSYKVLICNVCAFVQLFGINADKPIKPRQCGNRIRSLMVKSFTVTTWSGKKWERANSVLVRGHSLNGFPSGLTLILSRPYFRCTFPCHKGHIPNTQGNLCYLAGFVQRKHAVGSMVSSLNWLNGQFLKTFAVGAFVEHHPVIGGVRKWGASGDLTSLPPEVFHIKNGHKTKILPWHMRH